MRLEPIFAKYSGGSGGGDKGTIHSYLEIYENYIDRTGNLLEVGVYRGQSLKMWEEWIEGEVLGLDTSLVSLAYEVPAIVCDATNREQVRAALGAKSFTTILDDGSHQIDQQLNTLANLWEYLEPGGRYLIEDIQGEAEMNTLAQYAKHLGPVRRFDFRLVKNTPDDLLLMIDKL